MTLVEKIKIECKKKKMSLAALERACGFGNGSIRKWDTSPTSLERITKVAAVLEIPISNLLDESPENEKSPATNEGDKALEEFEVLFNQLSPEQKERELAYLRSLLAAANK